MSKAEEAMNWIGLALVLSITAGLITVILSFHMQRVNSQAAQCSIRNPSAAGLVSGGCMEEAFEKANESEHQIQYIENPDSTDEDLRK